MKVKLFTAAIAILMMSLFQAAMAQSAQTEAEDPAASAKIQFSSVLMGSLDNFSSIRGKRVKDDENYTYYDSEYGLGSKWLTVLNSKADTSEWFCFVRFHMIDDIKEVPSVETGVFELLNMVVLAGKITGKEATEGKVTRTDLYATAGNLWLGEVVSDSEKQTFHILLKNTKWK